MNKNICLYRKGKIMDKKKINVTLILIILCFIIRLVLSFFYYNYDDLYTFNFQWLKMIENNGLLHIYNITPDEYVYAVDYPPLFLIMLWVIKIPILYFMNNPYIFQFLMKAPALVFDTLVAIFLYKKIDKKASLLWAINIAVIVNSSMWGQTDNILVFFMILMFYYIHRKNINMIGVMVAFCILIKLQGIYMLPIYLVYLCANDSKFQDKLKSILLAIITGISVWLPFCIADKNILLPFEIYFGGYGKYKEICAGAANFWFFNVRVDYTNDIFYSNLGHLLLIVCILILIITYFKTKDIYISSGFYLFLVYMITLSQRERYGIYYTIMLLIIYFIYKENKVLCFYIIAMINNGLISLGFLLQKNYELTYIYTGRGFQFLPQEYGNIITVIWLFAVVINFIFIFTYFEYIKIKSTMASKQKSY